MLDVEIYRAQTRCISHEIRNHLSICELYSRIIEKNLQNENIQNPSISNALACIQKSLKIIGNSLLDLKSLNNFSISEHDLNRLLSTGIDLSMVYIADKNIIIKSDLCSGCLVAVDDNKFLACIVNIIKNAVEAIDKKGTIQVKCFDKNGLAHILISNDGRPISSSKQKQIFDEGFTTKADGSGLGLHICKNNLAMQNAELHLNKSDKKSTEFEIVLPIISNI